VPLRIGLDVDGVLANFASAYYDCEARLFGADNVHSRPGDPENQPTDDVVSTRPVESPENAGTRPQEPRRRRDAVWQAIRESNDFWTMLKPIEEGAVARLYALTRQHQWEVFFIVQRPASRGDSVQRQTQRWLAAQGFEFPSVLTIPGSRGAAAAALRLDYHVDDSARNCIDVKAHSAAKPILVVDPSDAPTIASAQKLDIGTVSGVAEWLDILDRASVDARRSADL
jgi:hypothetical protein